jgi:hypothetical protein
MFFSELISGPITSLIPFHYSKPVEVYLWWKCSLPIVAVLYYVDCYSYHGKKEISQKV